MTHSASVILDFISEAYLIPPRIILSGDRRPKTVKARGVLLMLVGMGRDDEVAQLFGRSEITQRFHRRKLKGYLKVDKKFKAELELMEKQILYYEIDRIATR